MQFIGRIPLTQQTKHLLEAFTRTSHIENQLLQLKLKEPENDILQKQADKTLHFIQKANRILHAQSSLLDRAQPRIKALFKNLDIARFDRHSEKFLMYLLSPELTEISPAGNPQLPSNIKLKSVTTGSLKMRHLSKTTQIFPPVKIPIIRTESDKKAEADFFTQTQTQVRIHERVSFWLAELIKAVKQSESISFEIFAIQIIANEDTDEVYVIMAFLIARLLNEIAPQQGWKIETSSHEPTYYANHSLLKIWPLQINLS